MKIQFTKELDNKLINISMINEITNIYNGLLSGKWEILFQKQGRTPKQNRTIHALFSDLAVELGGLGIEYKMGNFKASWTANSAKEFFKQIYLAGKETSKTKTDELANATNKLINDINKLGGQLSIKEPLK